MNKKEFLKRLEEAMLEQMDISEAAPHIRYYQDYIDNEVKKGRNEEDVVASLQNPRLIAKNLVSNSKSANKYKSNIYDGNAQSDRNDKSNYYGENEDKRENKSVSFSINGKPINSLLFKIALVAIVMLVLVIVLVVALGVMWLMIKFVLPLVFVGVIVYILVNVIKKSL